MRHFVRLFFDTTGMKTGASWSMLRDAAARVKAEPVLDETECECGLEAETPAKRARWHNGLCLCRQARAREGKSICPGVLRPAAEEVKR